MRAWFGVVAALAFVGCIPRTQLQPRSDAQALAQEPNAAVTEQAGIKLVADGAAWKGQPGNLDQRLTPVEVRLENLGNRPLRIRYEQFGLMGGSRFEYTALPPLSLKEATESEPLCSVPAVPLHWHASWGWRRGMGLRPWGLGPFYDPFYDPNYTRAIRCHEPLPTQDMLKKALPEGTLAPGGSVSGFLYFQGIADRESQVTLQTRLVDAHTGETFGELGIPFVVR
ncbi:hypothetical protein [Stigmatella aurantiaca]|uniref:Conserved uncharacterized protein n=1 Tax=Stigmatella aurantiaca (strain DW4/3-1) TaxID=378806 RepID=Q096R6_STIAD|nr:hypothetical protein [Stigmatella aurantiaca]ADO68558.1 conserved uncharacterized protein [Stigmatella aurantiaca DW4/3-1]EAU67733.1 conserved hypothetical protein [Stigmatella aurantiaca DW4/3-1]